MFQKGNQVNKGRKPHNAFQLGHTPWNKGEKMSEEFCKKNSESHKGQKSWHKNPLFSSKEVHLSHNRKRYAIKKGAIGSHTLLQWMELKKMTGYMCLCCKKIEPEIVLSEDHIIPLSKGGTDYIENIQPLCRSCNSRKNAKVINYIKKQPLENVQSQERII